MIKKAYSISMAYEVSDAEKIEAEKALIFFKSALKKLSLASDHLNIMKTPFKEDDSMKPENIMQVRSAIRRFRDKSVENFNDFKNASFKCVNSMQLFSSDTQTVKLMKSFISSVDELESRVNQFVDLFDDLQTETFSKDIVNNIEDIQSKCEDIEEIVDERIKNHIQSNILATSWVDSVSNELQMKVEKKTPIIIDLYRQREEQLNNLVKERVNP